MTIDKKRYKLVDSKTVKDTHSTKKYDIAGIVKVLNDVEYHRKRHQKKIDELEGVMCDMTIVIDGFVTLEKLRNEGWI